MFFCSAGRLRLYDNFVFSSSTPLVVIQTDVTHLGHIMK